MKNFLKVLIFICSISNLQFAECKSEITINNEKFEKYISKKQIQARIKELATQIDKDYHDKTPLIIGVLKGSVIFLSDLVRQLETKCELDFIKIASYGHSYTSSGEVKLLANLSTEIEGRDIIIVEDIIDTGLSMKFLHEHLNKSNPKSISVASLLVKKECIKHPSKIDYVGFEIAPEFVIGYGLDHEGKYRNLKSIYRLSK